MIQISYHAVLIGISILWCAVRLIYAVRSRQLCWKREAQLMLVFICISVVARFTFFPFSRVNGEIQPLVFSMANAFPFRINFVPFVYLFDYPETRDILRNVIGNTAMFIPLGIVWPAVFKELNTHVKVLAAGIGTSLLIEILQLPFFDRVSDIDDLILNSLGFLTGYLIYLLITSRKRKSSAQ